MKTITSNPSSVPKNREIVGELVGVLLQVRAILARRSNVVGLVNEELRLKARGRGDRIVSVKNVSVCENRIMCEYDVTLPGKETKTITVCRQAACFVHSSQR